jgi:DNA-binding GntR family transcriptional regulator
MRALTAQGAHRTQLRIRRSSTVEQVVTALSEAIFAGRLPPGTALRELALADELEVSRTSVREAIRVLGADGLVHHVANHGARVASLSKADIDDIYAAREVIELAGIEAIRAGRRTSVLDELEVHVELLERAVTSHDAETGLTHDRAFHHALAAAQHSRRLLATFEHLQAELRLALSFAERSIPRLGRSRDDHRPLLDAIRTGSAKIARKALQDHLATGRVELHRLRELIDGGQLDTQLASMPEAAHENHRRREE